MSSVFVNFGRAGEISRAAGDERRAQFLYSKGADVLSLTMPVRAEAYQSERAEIHPIFDMNLPEGFLYKRISDAFAKVFPKMDKFLMLQITGRSQIGRIRVASSIEDVKNIPARPLKDLLSRRGAGELFEDLVENYARYSGVAGVQPKVLARDDGSLGGKVTAYGTTHIVKAFETAEFPALATNEFLCLQVARLAGLPTSNVRLSDDRLRLIVDRFDLNDDGTYKAFEDMCVLRQRQSDEKYWGSYEQIARKLVECISPAHVAEDLRTYFETVVLACAVRNGDAHAKNFGIVYNNPGAARIAPVYDVVTTTAYDAKGLMALTLNFSIQWPGRRQLLEFGTSECGLAVRDAEESVSKIADCVAQTRKKVARHIADLSAKRDKQALRRMAECWDAGLAGIS